MSPLFTRWGWCALAASIPQEPAQEVRAAPASSGRAAIGDRLPDLSFVDLDGASGRLSDYADREALVVVVRHLQCPKSAELAPRLAELESQYLLRGVGFVYVDLAGGSSDEALRAEAKEHSLQGRQLRDGSGRFGFGLGASSSTQAFVLDARRRLRYRGAAAETTSQALDAILARDRVAVPECDAPGLELRFDPPPADDAAPPALTWHGDLRLVAEARCQRCHRPGGGGPFSLLESADFAGRDAMVRRVIAQRVMPPWYASARSEKCRNDTRLTDDERKLFLRWIQDGCEEGTASGEPSTSPTTDDWRIPTPDIVFELPRDYPVPATGVLPYVHLSTDYVLPETVWVQAIEVKPRCPQVVHHLALVATDEKGLRGELLDGYLPGKEPTIYPEGMAKLLKKGTRFNFSVHFTPNGTACSERLRVGIVTAKTKPNLRVSGFYVRALGFVIPPGAREFAVTAEKPMPADGEIVRLIPHMHLRGKSFVIELVFPDGTSRRPLEIDRWHPDWQFAYDLERPIAAPKGTIVRVTGVFDNSAANPFNPDPGKRVFEGPQIFNEMAESVIEFVAPTDGDGG